MSALRWRIALGAVVLLLAAGTATWLRSRAQASSVGPQPFPFNHKLHIAAKVDCLQCHEGILDASAAKLPALEICAGCHKDPPGANPKKQQLAALVTAGKPLAWNPATREPDHVFFPHQRHVDVAGLECKNCHAAVIDSSSPPTKNRAPSMAQCIACHSKHPERPAAKRASTDCASCHR